MLTSKEWGLSFDRTFTPQFGLVLKIYINKIKFRMKEQPVFTFHMNGEKLLEQETGENDIIRIERPDAREGDSYQVEIGGEIIFRGRC